MWLIIGLDKFKLYFLHFISYQTFIGAYIQMDSLKKQILPKDFFSVCDVVHMSVFHMKTWIKNAVKSNCCLESLKCCILDCCTLSKLNGSCKNFYFHVYYFILNTVLSLCTEFLKVCALFSERLLLDVSWRLEDSWQWILRVQPLQRKPWYSQPEPAGSGQGGP